MNITYYGHSCFGVEVSGKHLLFDPFISPNEKAAHIDVDAIPADYILVSHAHGDHIADLVSIGKRTGATIISNYEIVTWCQGQGLDKGQPMNHGGQWTFDFGSVKVVNAIHSSSFPDGSYGGNPAGFVVTTPEGAFYYSGDTALTYDMKLIGDQHRLKFAFLCIGDNFTMGVKDAIRAAKFIDCDDIIGMHYDTFGYIEIDHGRSKAAFAAADKSLTLMRIGDQIQK
ncbi:MAG: metal-dependent hydrolase [Bacteroidetes bacterium]|nr:MAG: metal-dependent hydrolase [Bacteroidota bacterium]